MSQTSAVPIIDISSLREGDDGSAICSAIDAACRDTGFFCIIGHGVPAELYEGLDRSARDFFALPDADKATIGMAHGGPAWRGWFPLGGELTNGIPDRKEGVYFGQELAACDPRVLAGLPLHGPNLFPDSIPELAEAVLGWIDALTDLGHLLLSALATGLGLPPQWFREHLTDDPTVLFRIFRYPPHDVAAVAPDGAEAGEWGVAEHTDYGLLTLLAQDHHGGLQVRGRSGWIDVAPIPGAFVCNIGDMLERITGGRYRSTPHRVRNTSGGERLSFPFFFDPSWNAHVEPLPLDIEAGDVEAGDAEASDIVTSDAGVIQRWDGRSVFDFDGTYGEYLTAKVAKVFPALFSSL